MVNLYRCMRASRDPEKKAAITAVEPSDPPCDRLLYKTSLNLDPSQGGDRAVFAAPFCWQSYAVGKALSAYLTGVPLMLSKATSVSSLFKISHTSITHAALT